MTVGLELNLWSILCCAHSFYNVRDDILLKE
nr:MAG TPA: hypothetical protein [Caudoviricetes sp.]